MLKVGVVGLPNVGKSTLFNAILKREQALSANYPFATIEPNVGIVDVVDKRLQNLAKIVEQNEGSKPPIIYATIEFVDIAGLVEGANKGEGLGNKFLANIREVDMILHVVRDFNDTNVIREHSKNPDNDTEVINNELILKDIESIEKKIKSIGRSPESSEEIVILNKYLELLNKGKFALELNPTIKTNNHPGVDKDFNKVVSISKSSYMEYIKPLFLLTDKEMVYVINVDENDERLFGQKSKVESQTYKGKHVIYINAKLESELSSLDQDDQKAYLHDLGIKEPGLDKITRLCFSTLGLISYFTAGIKEVRAWEININSSAVEAAGKIHTDFMKNFIKAEVISYEDYIRYKTKSAARDAGKLRLEGKEYIVKDGDVIEFKIGS